MMLQTPYIPPSSAMTSVDFSDWVLGVTGDNFPLSLVNVNSYIGFTAARKLWVLKVIVNGARTQFTLLEDAKAISDQDQIVAVHCRRYRRSKNTRSERLGRHKIPSLARAILEDNTSARGDVTVTGETNSQQRVFGKDPAILIVSRRRQSEVESATVPVRTGIFHSRVNSPERRGDPRW